MRKGKIHDKIFAILFHFPSFCLYTVFLILPLVASFFIALLKWNGVGDSVFVGLDNFLDIFVRDRYFKKNNRQYIDQYGSWSFYPASAGFDSGLHGLSCEKGFQILSDIVFRTGSYFSNCNRLNVFIVL